MTHYWEEQELIGEGHWHNTGGPDGGPWYHTAGAIRSPTRHQTFRAAARTRRGLQRFELEASLQLDHRQGIPSGMDPQVDLKTRYVTADLRWHHLLHAAWPGSVGLSLSRKDNLTYGPEVLLPNSTAHGARLFFLQHLEALPDLRLSAGLRLDGQWLNVRRTQMVAAHVDAYGREIPAYIVPSRTTTYGPVLSVSAGFLWHQSRHPFSLAANVGSGWRAPTPVELHIRGVHHASYEYMLGDPELDRELAVNTDLILRWADTRVVAEASMFYNRIHDYIFANPTGAFHYLSDLASLPVYRYEQRHAAIRGFEWRSRVGLAGGIWCHGGYDLARGDILGAMIDADADGRISKHLPRMSPDRLVTGVSWSAGNTGAELNVSRYLAQKRLGEFENVLDRDTDGDGQLDRIASPGYTLIDLHAHALLDAMVEGLGLSMALKNLLNTAYWSHLSMYKGIANNPGFDLSVMLTFVR